MVERVKKKIKKIPHTVKYHGKRAFSSLMLRNYRLYFVGQSVSMVGSWMQAVTQMILVMQLAKNDAGTALGILLALEFIPMLLLAPYGGLLADRFSKRKLLLILQIVSGIMAVAQGVLVMTGTVQMWMIYIMAVLLGLISAITMPVQQSFVPELVGPKLVGNAINLNSIIMNLSRAVGPALAAVVIAQWGLGISFFINAFSFVAVIICLLMMRHDELHLLPDAGIEKGQLKEAFVYAGKSPLILSILVMVALVGMFTYEFSVTLPLLVKELVGGAGTATESSMVAQFMGYMGLGAIIGALFTSGRKHTSLRNLVFAAAATGLAVLITAFMSSQSTIAGMMILVGIGLSLFVSFSNALLQQNSLPKLRGRIMAFWTMAYLGTTVFGAPIIGWIGQYNPHTSLVVGAVASFVAGIVGLFALRHDTPNKI